MDPERLKQDVLTLFEYAHHREDWVNPLSEAMAGLTAEDAAAQVAPNLRSRWQIVLHMTVWSDHVDHIGQITATRELLASDRGS